MHLLTSGPPPWPWLLAQPPYTLGNPELVLLWGWPAPLKRKARLLVLLHYVQVLLPLLRSLWPHSQGSTHGGSPS